jgi:hypothetical protein
VVNLRFGACAEHLLFFKGSIGALKALFTKKGTGEPVAAYHMQPRKDEGP